MSKNGMIKTRQIAYVPMKKGKATLMNDVKLVMDTNTDMRNIQLFAHYTATKIEEFPENGSRLKVSRKVKEDKNAA